MFLATFLLFFLLSIFFPVGGGESGQGTGVTLFLKTLSFIEI